jgi:hypothetical protein
MQSYERLYFRSNPLTNNWERRHLFGVRKLACAFIREASFARKGGSKLPHSKKTPADKKCRRKAATRLKWLLLGKEG